MRKDQVKMSRNAFALKNLCLATAIAVTVAGCRTDCECSHPWTGKTVAFLGDSITDPRHVGTTRNYWQGLEDLMGIRSEVFAVSGFRWFQMPQMAEKLKAKLGDKVDAILIFAGTNDYNHGDPLGVWYEVTEAETERNGRKVTLPRRTMSFDSTTMRGNVNRTLAMLKHDFPDAQIVLLTPIHRAAARFSQTNVQPDESFPNDLGLYVDAYVRVVREAADVWAVPVVDLAADSGLYPLEKSHAKYFHRDPDDLLHPNAAGHLRMAKTLAARLASLPPGFRDGRTGKDDE